MLRPLPLVSLLLATSLYQIATAQAQTLDLGSVLGGLRGTVATLLPSTSAADRATVLQGVTESLIGTGGVLSNVETAVNAQANLLTLQTGDLRLLSSDVALIRTSTQNTATDIADLRTTVTTHETRLNDQSTQIDVQADLLAELDARQIDQGRRVSVVEAQSERQTGEINRLSLNDRAQDARIATYDRRIGQQEQATAALADGVTYLSQRVESVARTADVATEGVAMALALKSPAVADDKTFALSGGWGTFEGRHAFAVSGAVRANSALQFDAGVAVGAENSSVGGRAGATISW
jgi:hypothetical protein